MVSLSSIPSMQDLPFLPDECGEGLWIKAEDFMTFLRQDQPEDVKKKIRTDAIVREVRRHNNGMRVDEEDKKQISFHSILRYCFSHADDFILCRLITSEVECSLLKSSPSVAVSSILEVYRHIAKTQLKDPLYEDEFMKTTDFDKLAITTLEKIYRKEFTDSEPSITSKL